MKNGIVIALGLLGAAGPMNAQQEMFVLRAGQDTISLERFTRTPTRIESELLVKGQGVRIGFVADIAAGVSVRRFENRVWMAGDGPTASPRQNAVVTFQGDSAMVEIATGGQPQTQRFGSKAGALPHINPSFALIELGLARARADNVGEITFFSLAGGRTFTMQIKPLGTDSLILSIPGGETRLRVDGEGRILGGVVPSQNLFLDRVAGGAASMAVTKPDYGAPAGAPYTATDVAVPTPMGHTLAGTLTVPKTASASAPVPAVVTITGSGLQDRDEALTPFKGYGLFRELADSLSRRGIAVLRMDDRGFGGSGGNSVTATSADFAQDIAAGLAFLRTRPEIAGARLGLVGHSEGGLIAPLVAKGDPRLAGIVLLAGPAYTGRQILVFQNNNAIKNDTTLSPRARDSMFALVPKSVDSAIAGGDWLKFFGDYDPVETARVVKTPVLILNGATDQQVTPDQVPLLEAAFKKAGNPDVTAMVLPNLNHLFVYDPDGFPGRYTDLKSFAVDRGTIGIVADWLAKRLSRP